MSLEALRWPAKALYFIPLCGFACFVTMFTFATIGGHSFATDVKNSESQYRLYDFSVYYLGGKIAMSPDRASLYKAEVQHRYLDQLRRSAPVKNNVLVMQYAPFVPCLLIPLAMLPVDQALAVFMTGSMLAYFIGFFTLIKMRRTPFKTYQTAICCFAFIGSVPIFITATLGQASNYLFMLVCAYFFCLLNKKDKWAGIFLALTSFKPHYALFWAIPALAQKRWAIIITAALMEMALLVMAALILGWKTVLGYPAAIVQGDNSVSGAAILMISLRGLLYTYFHSWPWVFQLTLALLPLALLLLYFMWRRLAGGNDSFQWLCSATVIFCLFFAVHVYVYDAVLLLIPGLLCVNFFKLPEDFLLNKNEIFIQTILQLTPYIQWWGLITWPNIVHRSLPASFILLVLSTAFLVRFGQSLKLQKTAWH